MTSSATAQPCTEQPASFRHEAMFYEGEEGFLAGTVPFVTEGLDGGELVLVVVDKPKIDAIRRAVGSWAGQLSFADMASVGRNPARIIPAWQRFVDSARARGRPFRGIGEPISAERSRDELAECHRHESLLNAAFAASEPWWLLCPYDVGSLSGEVIEEAQRHHPLVFDGERHATSPGYLGDFDVFGGPLPEAVGPVAEGVIQPTSLSEVRRVARSTAMSAHLSDDRADDFELAVHELAANCLHHGGGDGRLRAWNDAGTAVCEVRDAGVIKRPLVGRIAPDATAERGRGLWLVNQLCDLVQIRSSRLGSVVRIRVGPG
jgi:anti-sigma regulatory factor (Ser/Thr protein kinase)